MSRVAVKAGFMRDVNAWMRIEHLSQERRSRAARTNYEDGGAVCVLNGA